MKDIVGVDSNGGIGGEDTGLGGGGIGGISDDALRYFGSAPNSPDRIIGDDHHILGAIRGIGPLGGGDFPGPGPGDPPPYQTGYPPVGRITYATGYHTRVGSHELRHADLTRADAWIARVLALLRADGRPAPRHRARGRGGGVDDGRRRPGRRRRAA